MPPADSNGQSLEGNGSLGSIRRSLNPTSLSECLPRTRSPFARKEPKRRRKLKTFIIGRLLSLLARPSPRAHVRKGNIVVGAQPDLLWVGPMPFFNRAVRQLGLPRLNSGRLFLAVENGQRGHRHGSIGRLILSRRHQTHVQLNPRSSESGRQYFNARGIHQDGYRSLHHKPLFSSGGSGGSTCHAPERQQRAPFHRYIHCRLDNR